MTPRRILALLLFLSAGLAQLEPVWGEMRDGEVHHETTVAAAMHASRGSDARGEHGHEDAGLSDHRHGEEHEHGTSADHCTHQHGAAVVTSIAFSVPPDHSFPAYANQPTPVDWTPTGFFRPPKA